MKQKLFFTAALLIGFLFSACEKDKFEGKACFSYSPTDEISVGENIAFTNCSENASNFIWSFGDGTISSEKEPTHSYSKAGTYTVTLAVQNQEFSDVNADMVIDENDRYPDSDLISKTVIVVE